MLPIYVSLETLINWWDAIGGEACQPFEVASFYCFVPCIYGWVTYSGVVEFDELGGVLAFVNVVCKKFLESYGSAGTVAIFRWDEV